MRGVAMNLLALLGSPKEKGNTALLLDHYLRGVKECDKSARVETVFLHGKDIHPCTGCYTCVDTGGTCVIDDDMQDLYTKLKEADVFIFATPIYWWSITAQLKKFIDRMCPITSRDLEGKKFVLLMTYGAAPPNRGPEMVTDMFKEIWHSFKVDFVHVYSTCTEDYLPVSENEKAQRDAYELGKDLVQKIAAEGHICRKNM